MRTFFCLFLISCSLPLFALDEFSLRDPRPTGWVVDQTRGLSQSSIADINRRCDAAKRETGGEIAVIVVDTTGGANHRDLGTRVFNRWGLGDRNRHDGILIFLALSDRRVEIILGDGVDSTVMVNVSQNIVDNDMKPALRSGDLGKAVLAGVNGCATRILKTSPPAAVSPMVPAPTPAPAVVSQPVPKPQPTAVEVQDLPLERASAPVPAPRPPQRTPQPYYPIHETAVSSGGGIEYSPLMALCGVGGIGGLGWWLLHWRRYHKRQCSSCRIPMVLLSEAEDDAHLNSGEHNEERVGSVDYDVWACPSCSRVEKTRYRTWFTSYGSCPSCDRVTKHSRSYTVRSASYVQGGLVQIDESCANCSYHNSYYRSTPRLVESSSSNSSFSSGSSFGSSSSGGGSSSSGGGHSSGRGGGSW